MITVLSSEERSPSKVHSPPLAQAQTSTLGLRVDEAFNASLAKKVRDVLVGCWRVQKKVNTPSPWLMSSEEIGSPPRTPTTKVFSASVTVKVYCACCPTVTVNKFSPAMLGGKLAKSMKRSAVLIACYVPMSFLTYPKAIGPLNYSVLCSQSPVQFLCLPV